MVLAEVAQVKRGEAEVVREKPAKGHEEMFIETALALVCTNKMKHVAQFPKLLVEVGMF